MLQGNRSQAKLLARLLSRALENRAHVTTGLSRGDEKERERHTVHISTSGDRHRAVLVPVPAGAGYPQDVRRALATVANVDKPAVPVLVARRMSPGARAMLDDTGLCWADADGNVRLSVGPVVVVLDAPASPVPPLDEAREVRWADATGAVAELLLGRAARDGAQDPLEPVTAIAAHLGISAPLVSRALKQFDVAGWTRRTGPDRGPQVARRLTDPGAMLSAWAAWHTTRRLPTTTTHALIQDLAPWLRDLRDRWPSGRWCVTGEAAAQMRAPYLSRVSLVEIYLAPSTYDEQLDHLIRAASLSPVTHGGRVRLIRADPYLSPLVADSGSDSDIPLVPDIRLYADLLGGGVRGDEAASELRDRRIGF